MTDEKKPAPLAPEVVDEKIPARVLDDDLPDGFDPDELDHDGEG